MYSRLKLFSLMSVSLIFSLSLPVYGETLSRLLNQNISSSIAQNSTTEADKLFEQGVQEYRRGKYPQALKTYERVLTIRRQQGDKAGIAQTLNNIGEVYLSLIKYDKALEVLQQALAIRREIKDRKGEGETLDNLASAYFGKQQDEKALKTFQQALVIRKEVKIGLEKVKLSVRLGMFTFMAFRNILKH